jgi:hypothetical protein
MENGNWKLEIGKEGAAISPSGSNFFFPISIFLLS